MCSQDFWQVLGENRSLGLFAHPLIITLCLLISVLSLFLAWRNFLKNKDQSGYQWLFAAVLAGWIWGLGPAAAACFWPQILLKILKVQTLYELLPAEVTLLISSLRSLSYLFWIGFFTVLLGTAALWRLEWLLEPWNRQLSTTAASDKN